jgi:hypothetical protein
MEYQSLPFDLSTESKPGPLSEPVTTKIYDYSYSSRTKTCSYPSEDFFFVRLRSAPTKKDSERRPFLVTLTPNFRCSCMYYSK